MQPSTSRRDLKSINLDITHQTSGLQSLAWEHFALGHHTDFLSHGNPIYGRLERSNKQKFLTGYGVRARRTA